ncbi:MAG TPA: heme-binding protein, partial [Myxococcaceae bacterium]|nr:heme-binding protein [Myxococcaceae bacterium]
MNLRLLLATSLLAAGTARVQLASSKVLTLDAARRIAAAAAVEARSDRTSAIAIVDAGGALVYFERFDGTFPAASAVSFDQAHTAATFQHATRPSPVSPRGSLRARWHTGDGPRGGHLCLRPLGGAGLALPRREVPRTSRLARRGVTARALPDTLPRPPVTRRACAPYLPRASQELTMNLDVLRTRILAVLDRISWIGPLAVRLSLGAVFLGTGWGKLHNLEQVTAFFTELGIPFPAVQAAMVSGIELV